MRKEWRCDRDFSEWGQLKVQSVLANKTGAQLYTCMRQNTPPFSGVPPVSFGFYEIQESYSLVDPRISGEKISNKRLSWAPRKLLPEFELPSIARDQSSLPQVCSQRQASKIIESHKQGTRTWSRAKASSVGSTPPRTRSIWMWIGELERKMRPKWLDRAATERQGTIEGNEPLGWTVGWILADAHNHWACQQIWCSLQQIQGQEFCRQMHSATMSQWRRDQTHKSVYSALRRVGQKISRKLCAGAREFVAKVRRPSTPLKCSNLDSMETINCTDHWSNRQE